ncbi:MAG: septal ring lytic transglycosylase RlpA family protein [Betaproteobacteria bacterium]|nr:septal ring lytic transglycosylase RlpA family protein [Betaproteobacteria bacterium]
MRTRHLCLLAVVAGIAACSSVPKPETPVTAPAAPGPAPAAPPPSSSKYYLDDGPGDYVPANLDAIPDAVPRVEPLHRFANRPYSVFGREYVPATSLRPYRERGVASWYGRKFHGQKTSSGETYDMYGMTAAHPTLPLPSYARVTNTVTGRSVVVRVNDRGPFLHNRVIDLSFAAAHRIGIAQRGSGAVEVEAILVGDPVTAASAPLPPVAAAPMTPPPAGAPAGEAGAPVPVARIDGGFVVQLGAFTSNANAQNFVAHLANQLAPIGVEAKVRQVGGLFRVFVGPYAARDDARRSSDRLREALGLNSTIAVH